MWLCRCPDRVSVCLSSQMTSDKYRGLSYRWMLLKSIRSVYIFTTLLSFCYINTLIFFFPSLKNLSAVGPNFKGICYQTTGHQTTEHFQTFISNAVLIAAVFFHYAVCKSSRTVSLTFTFSFSDYIPL